MIHPYDSLRPSERKAIANAYGLVAFSLLAALVVPLVVAVAVVSCSTASTPALEPRP